MGQAISRITFGKLTNVEVMKMTPACRGGLGALLLEKGGEPAFLSDDVALVFKDVEDVDKLIDGLNKVKDLMKYQVKGELK